SHSARDSGKRRWRRPARLFPHLLQLPRAGSPQNDPPCRGTASSSHWQSAAPRPCYPVPAPVRLPHGECDPPARVRAARATPVARPAIRLLRGDSETTAATAAWLLRPAQSAVRFQIAAAWPVPLRPADQRTPPPCGWFPDRCQSDNGTGCYSCDSGIPYIKFDAPALVAVAGNGFQTKGAQFGNA